MRQFLGRRSAALIVVLTMTNLPARAAAEPSPGRRAAQEALKPYAGLVGEWRGTGQKERGKVQGAWSETASWAWKLSKNSAALETTITKGKYLTSALLQPGDGPKTFVLKATLADGSKRVFKGLASDEKPLALTATDAGSEGVRRITLTPLHDTRLLILLEGQGPDNPSFYRLGEVGYTRQGIAFAAGESGPVCIVTEGRGTMPVSYKGKTYWVCCTGCRDLFKEDPEAVLAEAEARKKK